MTARAPPIKNKNSKRPYFNNKRLVRKRIIKVK